MSEFKLLTNEETELLLKEAKSGNEKAKEDLLLSNYPLIKSIVKRFLNRGVDYEDLYQLGCVGFIKAVNNFDLSYNVKFSTYAVPMIAGEIKRFLRDDGIIKVSRSIKSLVTKINTYIDQKRREGKIVSIEELACEFGVDKEEIVYAMDSMRSVISLDEKIDESEDSPSLIDKIAVESSDNKTIEKIVLKEAIDSLSEKEKKIIMLRYFRGKTQTEIASLLGVSQVQVSRIESKILDKLKMKM